MKKDTLVRWKKKRDEYRDEWASDDTEVNEPRLVDTMGEPCLIMRDEFNAKAMRRMNIKWW